MSKEEFYSCFIKNNIRITEQSFKAKDELFYDDIVRQIDLIALFHNQFQGYKENLIPRLGSTIGKDLENYKLQFKFISFHLKDINLGENYNYKEEDLKLNVIKVIDKGNEAIANIIQSDYMNLIKRSMINYEVCLGKVDDSNLILGEDGLVNIGTINYLTYNLIEHDFCSYIKKVKRKIDMKNIDGLIERYVNKTKLDERSEEYIRAFLQIPTESLKVWNRYKNKKKYDDLNECLRALELAMKIDGII